MTAAGEKKTINDVDHPGKSTPSATSKPVIVSNRPLLKDPMVVDEDAALPKEGPDPDDKKPPKEELEHTAGPKLQPPDTIQPDDAQTQPAEKKETLPAQTEPPGKKEADPKQEAAEETAKQAAATQRLIDSKRYELPIDTVEKRKTKRFVVLGVVLAVLLTFAWIDVAIDAGIIHIGSAKPVTHFFSN
ncbi:MAG TPA: hypothetical protein VFH99_01785 [Candidatus Saccharimonadales bacterium]|nr:hypothetical protein [Candidatus Saccharimonadales bacterium]